MGRYISFTDNGIQLNIHLKKQGIYDFKIVDVDSGVTQGEIKADLGDVSVFSCMKDGAINPIIKNAIVAWWDDNHPSGDTYGDCVSMMVLLGYKMSDKQNRLLVEAIGGID